MKKNRVVFYLDDALKTAVQEHAIKDDCSVGAVCRRALRLLLFADQQSQRGRGGDSK
jgi:hypothetical protein